MVSIYFSHYMRFLLHICEKDGIIKNQGGARHVCWESHTRI
nr:MAG TPA: hypothetical protein [Caudoviricetes sp.]